MRDLGKIVVLIPARAGSKRVKAKNLRIIAGKPLLSYSISTALDVSQVSEVYVNSDSEAMLKLAERCGARCYQRDPVLASDTATGDEFAADFMRNVEADTVIMLNPVCPLLKSNQVIDAIEQYQNSDCDTLISCDSTQMQVFFENVGVNISTSEMLRPTQENTPVKTLNWAVTIWDKHKFLEHYNNNGYAYLGVNRLLFEIPPLSGIKISHEQDFEICEAILNSRNIETQEEIKYWMDS
ncbi:hypothetical protein F9817_21690 [Vibrio sp. CAIM 722]|uniref:Uncharacterized protein n=1 Tax=Vibrio eleionomae TaxID=2653505 RepID=A0A7X4LPV3_9VIBR|nr:acylneuraminate cytidylyltransferase family protein [Vibrio eleionomae]MZI95801.1 hypothetical protein [Vibrio eleionomae]